MMFVTFVLRRMYVFAFQGLSDDAFCRRNFPISVRRVQLCSENTSHRCCVLGAAFLYYV